MRHREPGLRLRRTVMKAAAEKLHISGVQPLASDATVAIAMFCTVGSSTSSKSRSLSSLTMESRRGGEIVGASILRGFLYKMEIICAVAVPDGKDNFSLMIYWPNVSLA
jgi:hypothetical protein